MRPELSLPVVWTESPASARSASSPSACSPGRPSRPTFLLAHRGHERKRMTATTLGSFHDFVHSTTLVLAGDEAVTIIADLDAALTRNVPLRAGFEQRQAS